MGFLKPPKPPPMPAIPPPPPLPPVAAVSAQGGEEEKTKERLRRKKGISSTVLTGLLPEQVPVTTPHLLSPATSSTG